MGGSGELGSAAGVEAAVEGQVADNEDGKKQEAQKPKIKEKRSCESMP